jgi:hypothetical protein
MKRNLPIILTAWTASFRTFTVMVQDNTIPKSDRPVYARDPLAVEMQVNMRRLTQWVSLEFFGPAPCFNGGLSYARKQVFASLLGMMMKFSFVTVRT